MSFSHGLSARYIIKGCAMFYCRNYLNFLHTGCALHSGFLIPGDLLCTGSMTSAASAYTNLEGVVQAT